MSLQWISGRTALVLVLFATFAAAAFLKGRLLRWRRCCASGRCLPKEEGVLLPGDIRSPRRSSSMGSNGPQAPPRAVDAVHRGLGNRRRRLLLPAQRLRGVRSCDGTVVLSFRLQPGSIATNALQYLDRTATFAVVVALFWVLVTRSRVPLTARAKRVMVFRDALVGGHPGHHRLAAGSFEPVCMPAQCRSRVGGRRLVDGVIRTGLERGGTAAPLAAFAPAVSAVANSTIRERAESRMEAELSTTTLAALQQVASRLGPGTVGSSLRQSGREAIARRNPFGGSIQEAADLMISPSHGGLDRAAA